MLYLEKKLTDLYQDFKIIFEQAKSKCSLSEYTILFGTDDNNASHTFLTESSESPEW